MTLVSDGRPVKKVPIEAIRDGIARGRYIENDSLFWKLKPSAFSGGA